LKLSPGERSILAYFPSSNKAQAAEKELKNTGLKNVQVDRVSRYGATSDAHYNNPINNARTETGPTLFSNSQGVSSQDARILMAADPSVSGYGNIDYGQAGGKAFLLTVVGSDDKMNRAEEIIRRNGGNF